MAIKTRPVPCSSAQGGSDGPFALDRRARRMMTASDTDVPSDSGDTFIIGRKRIAHALGRSERTISRWIRRGILPASNSGPHENNLLTVRVADLERLKSTTLQDGDE